MIELGIVEDHAIVRNALRQFFAEQVDLRVAGEASNAREALELVRSTPELNVLVMDLSLPGQSGIEAMRLIQAEVPHLRILILSGYPEEHFAADLIRQGASGYLNKECDPAEILTAIRSIALGRRYISTAVAQALAERLNRKSGGALHEELSEREFQVFMKLAKGASPGRVATEMALSIKTVSTYRTRLMAKMRLASNSALTYYAYKHSLLS